MPLRSRHNRWAMASLARKPRRAVSPPSFPPMALPARTLRTAIRPGQSVMTTRALRRPMSRHAMTPIAPCVRWHRRGRAWPAMPRCRHPLHTPPARHLSATARKQGRSLPWQRLLHRLRCRRRCPRRRRARQRVSAPNACACCVARLAGSRRHRTRMPHDRRRARRERRYRRPRYTFAAHRRWMRHDHRRPPIACAAALRSAIPPHRLSLQTSRHRLQRAAPAPLPRCSPGWNTPSIVHLRPPHRPPHANRPARLPPRRRVHPIAPI